jgi:hypothetical protein
MKKVLIVLVLALAIFAANVAKKPSASLKPSKRISLKLGRRNFINFAAGGYNQQQRGFGYLANAPSFQCRYRFQKPSPLSFLYPYGQSGLSGFVPSNGFQQSNLGVLYEAIRQVFTGRDTFQMIQNNSNEAQVGLAGLAAVLSGYLNSSSNQFQPSVIGDQQTVLCPIVPSNRIGQTIIVVPGLQQSGVQTYGQQNTQQLQQKLRQLGIQQGLQQKKQQQYPAAPRSQQFIQNTSTQRNQQLYGKNNTQQTNYTQNMDGYQNGANFNNQSINGNQWSTGSGTPGSQSGTGFGSQSGTGFGTQSGTGLGTQSGTGLGTQSGTGFGTQSGTGFGTQSGTGFGTQSGTGFGTQSGTGFGTQSGTGFGTQSGTGFGTQSGTGFGTQSGTGFGTQSGTGFGTQSGTGFGTQSGTGFGTQSGTGFGTQSGTGFGTQSGTGFGTQSGTGFGTQSGTGFGTQSGTRIQSTGSTQTSRSQQSNQRNIQRGSVQSGQNRGQSNCNVLGQGQAQTGTDVISAVKGSQVVLNNGIILNINPCTQKKYASGRRQFQIQDKVRYSYFNMNGVNSAQSIHCL